MEKELFDDFMQSLNEAVEYSKGDKTKGRSQIVTLPVDDISIKYGKLSEEDQKTIDIIIDKMLIASKVS